MTLSRRYTTASFALLFALRLTAQPGADASLAGTVMDQAGKGLPAASVVVKNEGSGETRRATTDTDGRFTVAGLAAGSYTIEVSAPNFSTSRQEGFKLAAGAKGDFATALGLAALPQTITVEGNVSVAAQAAPMQSSLEARSAQSRISGE